MSLSQHPTQFSLLADTPIARRRDPETSKIAARRITQSGERASQQQRILSLVNQRPGHTSAEIAAFLGMDRHIPARRLSELERQTLVKRGEKRDCQQTFNPSLTWYPL